MNSTEQKSRIIRDNKQDVEPDVEYRYDIKLSNGEVICKIDLDNLLVKLSPTHNGIGSAWRIEGNDTEYKKLIEVGTRIEMGNRILAKWHWSLYCTVIHVYKFYPDPSNITCPGKQNSQTEHEQRPVRVGGPGEPEWFRLLEQSAKDSLCSMVTQAVEHYGHLSTSAIEDVITKFQGSVDANQVREIHGYFYGQGRLGHALFL